MTVNYIKYSKFSSVKNILRNKKWVYFDDRARTNGLERTRLTVKFLTEFSSRPVLAVLAFAFGKTRTSLRARVGKRFYFVLRRYFFEANA